MKFRWSKLLLFTAIAALMAVLAGCSSTSEDKIESVAITPAKVEIDVGDTEQLKLTLTLESGNTLEADSVEWESADSTVAAVSSDGVVTGVSAGTTSITGTHAETHKDSESLRVFRRLDCLSQAAA